VSCVQQVGIWIIGGERRRCTGTGGRADLVQLRSEDFARLQRTKEKKRKKERKLRDETDSVAILAHWNARALTFGAGFKDRGMPSSN